MMGTKLPNTTEADKPLNCPHCGVSLLDEPIPEQHLENYAGRWFKREIGMEFPTKYDGIWYWECPDCKGQWGGARALSKES